MLISISYRHNHCSFILGEHLHELHICSRNFKVVFKKISILFWSRWDKKNTFLYAVRLKTSKSIRISGFVFSSS
jgi:hypothetical protein